MISTESIAKICHEANKAYCEAIGDFSQPNWENAPTWQKESAISGVEGHLKENLSPEQSHLMWCAKKIEDGWIWGAVKDPVAKTHPCIGHYSFLPKEQRIKDYIFKGIVDSFKAQIDV